MSEVTNQEIIMRCVAVDDEPLALLQLKSMIARCPELALVEACADAIEARTVLEREPVDVLFIDINMPEVNGLDFVASLDNPPLVVFTTAYSQYAVDSYKVNAVDYLLKPFGASIGKVEDFANDQQRFNRRIAVNKGTTATVTLISVVPKLQYVVAEPERNVPAIN